MGEKAGAGGGGVVRGREREEREGISVQGKVEII